MLFRIQSAYPDLIPYLHLVSGALVGLTLCLAALAFSRYAIRTLKSGFGWPVMVMAVVVFTAGAISLLSTWRMASASPLLEAAIELLGALVFAATAMLSWNALARDGAQHRQSLSHLQSAIRQLEHEIAERKRAELALQQSQESLRQLAANQEQVKEDERKRIAREIHDELGQNLMALRIDVSILHARTGHTHPVLNARVKHVLNHIDMSIKAVRAIINNLRPSVLDLGLHAAIEWQIKEFERRSGVSCELVIDDNEAGDALDDHRATALFRILQESLTNVARHSSATLVNIALRRDGSRYFMTIADNGVGLYPGCRRKPNSFGLLGIGERVATLGGEFAVDSVPGQGTMLTISIPVEAVELES